MKKLKLIYAIGLLIGLFTSKNTSAQWTRNASKGYLFPTHLNDTVGIGTSTPKFKLDVNGNFRTKTSTETWFQFSQAGPGGLGLLEWSDSSCIYVPRSRYIIRQSMSQEGLFYNHTLNQYEWKNDTAVTRASINIYSGDGFFAGKLGVGTSSPSAKLDVVNRSASYLANFDGGSSMWIALKENGLYRGYIGSYSGDSADVDFGTGASNNVGSVNLTIKAVPKLTIKTSGNVGIGTTTPTYKLDVCGTIRAKEIRVEAGWCDYVFADEYKLPQLSDVENYIKENKHLPDVTAGPEIEKEGLDVGKVSSQMIKKIEELTLYVIQLDKQNKELQQQINNLKK